MSRDSRRLSRPPCDRVEKDGSILLNYPNQSADYPGFKSSDHHHNLPDGQDQRPDLQRLIQEKMRSC